MLLTVVILDEFMIIIYQRVDLIMLKVGHKNWAEAAFLPLVDNILILSPI